MTLLRRFSGSSPAVLLAAACVLPGVAGCITESTWDDNVGSPQECSSDAQCPSGVCRFGVCHASAGELRLNCVSDDDCRSGICLHDPGDPGICAAGTCDSADGCPLDSSHCTAVTLTTGEQRVVCLPKCYGGSGCDTNSRCVALPEPSVCVPGHDG